MKSDTLLNKEELLVYNRVLEKSPEYQRVLPKVMKEVYTLFVHERIEQEEKWLETETLDTPFDDGSDESIKVSIRKRIAEAKRLLPDSPERAAQLLIQLGSCHLKEKYGITWYSPDELNPEIIYD